MAPNQMHPRTACGLLEVGAQAEKAEIEKAYKKLALKFHPDKNPHISTAAKEAFQLIQEAKTVLMEAGRPFYKLEDSPFKEEKQKAMEAKAEARRKQFYRRRMSSENWPSERYNQNGASGSSQAVDESLKWGAFFGNQGQWVCQTCKTACMVLRDVCICDYCGHSLKLHTGPGHSLYLPGDYCGGFMMKMKSSTCSCGCPCSAHKCVFTKAGERMEKKAATPRKAPTPRGGGKSENNGNKDEEKKDKNPDETEKSRPFVNTPFNIYGMNASPEEGPKLDTVFETGQSAAEENASPSDGESVQKRNRRSYAHQYNVTPPSMKKSESESASTPGSDDSPLEKGNDPNWEPASAKYGEKYTTGGAKPERRGSKTKARTDPPKIRPSMRPFQKFGKNAMSGADEDGEKDASAAAKPSKSPSKERSASRPTPRNNNNPPSSGPTPRDRSKEKTPQTHKDMMGELGQMARDVLGENFNLATGRTPRVPRERSNSNSPNADPNAGPTIDWGTSGNRPSIVESPKNSKERPNLPTGNGSSSPTNRETSVERRKREGYLGTDTYHKYGHSAPNCMKPEDTKAVSAVERAFLSAQSKVAQTNGDASKNNEPVFEEAKKPVFLAPPEKKNSKSIGSDDPTPSTLTPRSAISSRMQSDRSEQVTPIQKQKMMSKVISKPKPKNVAEFAQELESKIIAEKAIAKSLSKEEPATTPTKMRQAKERGVSKTPRAKSNNTDKAKPVITQTAPQQPTLSHNGSASGASSVGGSEDGNMNSERKKRKTFSLFFLDSEDGRNRHPSKETTPAKSNIYANKVSPRKESKTPRRHEEGGGATTNNENFLHAGGGDLLENTNSLFSSHFNWDESAGRPIGVVDEGDVSVENRVRDGVVDEEATVETKSGIVDEEKTKFDDLPMMGGFVTSAGSYPEKKDSPGKQTAPRQNRRATNSYPLSSPTNRDAQAIRTPTDIDASPDSLKKREEKIRAASELPGKKSTIYDKVKSSGYGLMLKLTKSPTRTTEDDSSSPRKDRTPKTCVTPGKTKDVTEIRFSRLLKKYG